MGSREERSCDGLFLRPEIIYFECPKKSLNMLYWRPAIYCRYYLSLPKSMQMDFGITRIIPSLPNQASISLVKDALIYVHQEGSNRIDSKLGEILSKFPLISPIFLVLPNLMTIGPLLHNPEELPIILEKLDLH